MRKKIFSIWSILLVLVVSLAVVVPGCDGACTGDIEVKATLCDAPWTGAVQYKLTGPGAAVINGNSVNATHSGVDCGNWTCEHVSGGPPGAYFVDITPPSPQEVTDGGTITFTLNFEEDQDAWIDFLTWTINGIPIEEYPGAEYNPTYGEWNVDVEWCNVIDVHYQQGVKGCEERLVALNETDELLIHWVDWYGDVTFPSLVHVLNDDCAVIKEPIQGPTPEKLDQVPSIDGETVNYCDTRPIPWCMNVTLDVETSWELVKCLNYTKTINWLHIGECEPPEPGMDSPCCVLFDLLLSGEPGASGFWVQMQSCATVELVDDEDVNPENNHACSISPLNIYYYPPPL